MEVSQTFADRKNIPGWGSDLDVKMRPGYPMWKRPSDGTGAHWLQPVNQVPEVPVFHSVERPELTPVFGTASPPRGLSGVLRRLAFKYSEGSWAHWMTLILADRIDVVEGVIDDLFHGHVPDVYKEMGGRAEMKYNAKGFQKKIFMVGLVALAIPALFVMNRVRKI